MEVWSNLLKFLDARMTCPTPFGWFHLLSWGLSILMAVLLCAFHKKDDQDRVRRTVMVISLIAFFFEILKQLNFGFSSDTSYLVFDFQWYAFPYQFCSVPMYVGILQGIIKKGKVHDALCSFLATYAIFAGVCVMIYPNDVFIETTVINIQTMVCHATMLPIGVYLIYTGHVKCEQRTILSAMCVFLTAMTGAVVLNESVYHSGVLGDETFNMFFVSRHFECTLPVYSLVHGKIPYVLSLAVYFGGFSAAAYIILNIEILIKKLCERLSAPLRSEKA